LRSFSQAFALAPPDSYAYKVLLSRKVSTAGRVANWSHWEEGMEDIVKVLWTWVDGPLPGRHLKVIIDPASAALLPLPLTLLRKIVERKAALEVPDNIEVRKYQQWAALDALKHGSKARLKVAYVSGLLFQQATGYAIQDTMGMHDRRSFEVYTYFLCPPDQSDVQKRVVAGSDHVFYGAHLSLAEVAARIYSDGIHILLFFDAGNAGERTALTYFNPAPIQVNYAGLAASSGAPSFLPWHVVDAVVGAPEYAHQYSEHLITVPRPLSYHVNDHRQSFSKAFVPPTRDEFQIPSTSFLYSAMHTAKKVTPDAFLTWMNIMRRIPSGLLWLSEGKESDSKVNYGAECSSVGINASQQIVWAPRMFHEEQVRRVQLADAFLDTFIYKGHATMLDVLWAPVPVVTIDGSAMASRAGIGMLVAQGAGDIVAPSIKSYEDLAVDLARNVSLRTKMKEKLTRGKGEGALYDIKNWVRCFEQALHMLWDMKLAGEPPHHMIIASERPRTFR